jgi:hypothetical protein
MLTTADAAVIVDQQHEIASQSRLHDLHHEHGDVRLYLLSCTRFWREEAADVVHL